LRQREREGRGKGEAGPTGDFLFEKGSHWRYRGWYRGCMGTGESDIKE
jgi:hypothetical protein